MIYIKNGTFDRIKDWTDNSICVVSDFDRTLTSSLSFSTWDMLLENDFVSDEFKSKMYKLVDIRKNVILLGDLVADITMIREEKRENALKIGFLERREEENMESYRRQFDIVCTNDTGFEEISEHIRLLKR